jgi:hypothetical protein
MKISRSDVEALVAESMLQELSPIGYVALDAGVLVRDKEAGWREGIFVQLSSPPAREICASAGVDIPAAIEYESGKRKETFSAAVGGRLSEREIGHGDKWFAVGTQQDIETAAYRIVSLLEQNEPWFAQFRDLRDVAEAYRRQQAIKPLGENDYWKQVFVFNYACMLLAADLRDEAAEWLREAERVIRSEKFVDKDDRARLARVKALLEDI